MKSTFLVVFSCLFIINNSMGLLDGKLLPLNYTIVSDTEDKSISDDHYKISGHVKMFSSTGPLENVLIGCTSSGLWIRSDKDGAFELELNSTDSVIYFYKEGWSEIVIEDYQFTNQHHVVLDVWMSQNQKPQLLRKPVIYMYSESDLTATVKIIPNGEFTFTYPEYTDSWQVGVKAEGGISVDNNNYPYLFWEAETHQLRYKLENQQIEGFMIKSSEVITFLEEKLSTLGLNQTEQTDFITYWGPILSQKEYAFMQFCIDEQYEEDIAQMDISPKPDCLKRVFIKCCALDDPNIGIDIISQTFETFERRGFTVIEWGGSVLDLNELHP